MDEAKELFAQKATDKRGELVNVSFKLKRTRNCGNFPGLRCEGRDLRAKIVEFYKSRRLAVKTARESVPPSQ